MSKIRIVSHNSLGFNLPQEGDASSRPWPFGMVKTDWRGVTAEEITTLEAQGNRADNWANILVSGDFYPENIHDCRFYGLNRIASMSQVCLEHNDLQLPAGLYSSCIVSCDIGPNTAIHNVAYLARTRIEERCILFNIQEMITTDHAKFGNGVVMDGEPEDVRIWLEIANENGGRKVLPFDGMLPADAWIWSKYRADGLLMKRFVEMTERVKGAEKGAYGVVGIGSVIKNSRILKDLRIGCSAYIKGVNKLKNLTVNSSPREPTQIGEGCELVNGIIGYGCNVFYGVKAIRFILNNHSSLKYGARLINSILGPNSTISCCEVLNTLLFNAHEQHHNSSFLCAGILKGMSNMASAATVGSNHNSRGADGEIVAERGFWPGLSVSLKHNSRFAAFTLIVKGSYPAELDIPLPFSLVSNDESRGRLSVMPGYWFRYNMYALARGSAKSASRDRRSSPCQHLEYDWLAPDTVDQMLEGRALLEDWAKGQDVLESGLKELLLEQPNRLESSRRPVRILYPGRAWQDSGRMIRFYCVRTTLLSGGPEALLKAVEGDRQTVDAWINAGGQLMRQSDIQGIIDGIKDTTIPDWPSVHAAYDEAAGKYDSAKLQHAQGILRFCIEPSGTAEQLIREALDTGDFICRGISESREKDYSNPFRNIVYDSESERDAVLGRFDDNRFIAQAVKDWNTLRDGILRAAGW